MDTNKVKNPYDFLCLFIHDEIIDSIVTETKRYACAKNNMKFSNEVTPKLIRLSQAILFLSGYLNPARRSMLWERREDTNNKLVTKAMSRNRFNATIKYIHFTDNNNQSSNDPFRKVQGLFKNINDTAKKFRPPAEHFSVDESMITVS